jgi:hypothetical protein
MTNLIVAIISTVLIGIAAVMGVFYGGTAYQNAQINTYASAIIASSQQILAAERLWATNNNQPDVSGMPNPQTVANGVTYFNQGDTNTGIALLISGGYLSSVPTSGGLIGTPWTPIGAQVEGCYNIQGYQGIVLITPFAYKSGNYVIYQIYINVPYNGNCFGGANGVFASSTTDVSQINHPIVKIAKAVNNTLQQISSSANMSYMPYIGLPYPPTVNTRVAGMFLDGNGNVQTNYCYLGYGSSGNNYYIMCVFGPS